MAYYNPNAYGLDASVTENMQPINVPPIGRYLIPKGIELNSAVTTLDYKVHARAKHIAYIPLVVDTTITCNFVGMFYYNANSCVSTWYYDLGLYEGSVSEEYPATKLADFGTLTIEPGVTAAPSNQLISISQTLDANKLYFLAIGIRWNNNTDQLANRSPHLILQQGGFAMQAKRGISNVASSSHGLAWMEQLGTYSGTLPTTTNFANSASVISVAPRIALARSA